MKLYYRGLSYEYNSKEAAKNATRPFEPVRHQGFAYNLTYRGATYRVDPNIEPREFDTPPVAYQLTHILHHRLIAKIEVQKPYYWVGWALPTTPY